MKVHHVLPALFVFVASACEEDDGWDYCGPNEQLFMECDSVGDSCFGAHPAWDGGPGFGREQVTWHCQPLVNGEVKWTYFCEVEYDGDLDGDWSLDDTFNMPGVCSAVEDLSDPHIEWSTNLDSCLWHHGKCLVYDVRDDLGAHYTAKGNCVSTGTSCY